MSKKYIQLFLFSLITNLAFSQVAELKHLDEIVIGPNNVNVKFTEQLTYYEQKYLDLLYTLDQMRLDMDMDLELNELKVRKRRNKKQIAEREIMYREVIREMEIIEMILLKWSQQFPAELMTKASEVEFDDVSKSDCYDLITSSKIYGQSEYMLLMPREKISWQEISKAGQIEEEVKSVQLQPASTKWVKKKRIETVYQMIPKIV